jgi:hypothetical protein
MDHDQQLYVPGVATGQSGPTLVNPTGMTIRPRFALEGHEDEIYHELRVGARATEPDYCAFLDQSWTFNRAMCWVTGPAETLLSYEAGGNLALTGEQRVADWFSDPANPLTHTGATLRFEKTAARQRDAVVLPGFQTNLDQHPTLHVTVSEANAAWQVCVLVKGRSGPPLLASDWLAGPDSVTLDLAAAWAAKGNAIRFAELHIALGVWSDRPATSATLTFTADLPGQAALIPCLPVIRTVGKPVPVAAVVVAADGSLPGAEQIQVAATVAGRSVPLQREGNVWRGEIAGLPVGEYSVALQATGAVAATASLALHVTDGQFLGYDAERKTLTRAGKTVGPVSGSYQGMVFARDPGTPCEALVQGQAAWEAWHQAEPEGEHWHYWEALTEAELDERFAYLQHCGWDILHICQGWGVWEKLDAGGHLAPHGAEQLALILRVAGRHGLALLQALSHYPYGSKFTPVLRQYLEAGYEDSDWTHLETPFTALFQQYLREYATLFRDETALFAMSTSGEGDIAAGPARVNDTYRFMREHMPKHVFLAEPIHRLHRLPEEQRAQWAVHGWSEGFAAGCRKDVAWEPQLAGSRMYWIGEALRPEIDLGVEFKFLQLGDYFMGEGSWPCPHRYARFMGHKDAWAGTERYRRRVRDSLYLGLVHRNPVLLTWDEQYTEDERIVLRQVREAIDWTQPFQQAPVGIRVDSPNVGSGPWGAEGRAVLGRYEEFFSALPLMTRYLTPEQFAPEGMPVLDARQPYAEPLLSAAFLASGPLQVSPDYRASYLWSADRRTLLAYVYNGTHHERLEGRPDLSGNWHRLPQAAACGIGLRNLPEAPLRCRLYSLAEKRIVRELVLSGGASVDLGVSTDDYCALVYQE